MKSKKMRQFGVYVYGPNGYVCRARIESWKKRGVAVLLCNGYCELWA
jgi:hypothetical protein